MIRPGGPSAGSLLAPATAVIFGDSITAQNAQPNVNSPSGDVRGYMSWANARLGTKRLKVVANAGVGGNTTTQMLARIGTDVISVSSGWVVMYGGINDITNDVASATTIANLKSMATTILATGRRLVMCTITPSDFASTAPRKAAAHAVNEWIRAYARATANVTLCDWGRYLADPSTGLPVDPFFQSTSPNRVHPEADGAALMGYELARVLEPQLVDNIAFAQSNDDVANILSNGTFTGTSGTLTGGAGATGSLATGWTFFTGDGGTSITALSKVNRTDGVQGQWQQMRVGPGNGTREVHLSGTGQNGTFGTDFSIGDTIYAQVEVDTDDDWVSAQAVSISVYFGGSATTTDSTDLRYQGSTPTSSLRARNICYSLRGDYLGPKVLRTPNIVIPSGADRVLVQLSFLADAGTVRWARAEARKVVTP